MNLYATLALSLALLSMDAFAASVCKGASLFNPSLREAIELVLFLVLLRPSLPSLAGVWDYWPANILLSGIIG